MIYYYDIVLLFINMTPFLYSYFLILFFSESHLRQMRLFAENPDQQIDEFSLEFERGFIEMLSYRHGTKRVQANRVYQEYIGDKHHIHMNATIWTSLTEICIYLGKEGKAVVDETEKGWFIQYIDRDPRLLAKQAAIENRKIIEYDEEERMKKIIDMQISAAAIHEEKKNKMRMGMGNDGTQNDGFEGNENGNRNGNEYGYLDNNLPQDFVREEGASKIEMSLGGRKLLNKKVLKMISFTGMKGSIETESGGEDGGMEGIREE